MVFRPSPHPSLRTIGNCYVSSWLFSLRHEKTSHQTSGLSVEASGIDLAFLTGLTFALQLLLKPDKWMPGDTKRWLMLRHCCAILSFVALVLTLVLSSCSSLLLLHSSRITAIWLHMAFPQPGSSITHWHWLFSASYGNAKAAHLLCPITLHYQ